MICNDKKLILLIQISLSKGTSAARSYCLFVIFFFFFFCSCCKKIFCFCLSAGHVFPEFKESDAMFAAERVRYFVFLVLLMCEESYVFVACAPYIEK